MYKGEEKKKEKEEEEEEEEQEEARSIRHGGNIAIAGGGT